MWIQHVGVSHSHAVMLVRDMIGALMRTLISHRVLHGTPQGISNYSTSAGTHSHVASVSKIWRLCLDEHVSLPSG